MALFGFEPRRPRHSFQSIAILGSVLIPRIPSQNQRREDGTGCVLDELKLFGGEREVGEGRGGGSEEGNSGGKPRPGSSDPDEEHRASAGIRRRRRKRVLNAEIAIYLKRYACSIGAVLDIPVICAEQRRKYARAGVASDPIACAQKETLAVDLYEPAHPHFGQKVPDHPDLASGWDAKHGCICWTSGNIANSSTECGQVLGQGRLSHGPEDGNYGDQHADLFHDDAPFLIAGL